MARILETTVYMFDELSEAAKENARDWYRRGLEFDAEYILDDAARLGAMLGITFATRTIPLHGGGTRQEPQIAYSGFCSQGDGASFTGSYSYKAGSVTAIAKEAPEGDAKTHASNNEINRIARGLQEVQRRNFYQVQATIGRRSHHYVHSMAIDVERADEKAISEADSKLVEQLLRDVADWIYASLEQEWEYQNEDATIDENILANEYEFTADGRRHS